MKSTWKAAVPIRFANATIANVKRLMGTLMPDDAEYQGAAETKSTFRVQDSNIPETFDAREKWSSCASVIGRVRDQSNCGSCWAFASTETFNDRFCIATGDAKTIFSPEDTSDCCSGSMCLGSKGCSGGLPSGAWNWFTKVGVSTGGDYNEIGKGQTCKPYSLPSCAHHIDPPSGVVACDSLPSYDTPQCTLSCSEATYGIEYVKDKHFASSSYNLIGENHMQKEILEYGPVTVGMIIFEDFEVYSSGVYQHLTGGKVGAHAVKIIGWGVENGTPYWLVVNSWNTTWGINGLFKILRGANECMIETAVVAGTI